MSKQAQIQQKPEPEQAKVKTATIETQPLQTAVSPIPVLQRAYADPSTLTPADVKILQRTIGNQAIRRMMIQRKMTVGPVGDKYEQEADAVAKQVVSNLHTTPSQTAPAETTQRQEEEEDIQMKPLSPISALQRQEEDEDIQMKPISALQRQEEDEDIQMKPWAQRQEEEELQAKGDPMLAGGELGNDVESSVQSAKSGGQKLDNTVRKPMERAFNADFSNIKIHTGNTADTLNRSLSARAFTSGQDVFFRSGEYNPGSTTGQELLAHELTHTVQQGAAAVQRAPQKTDFLKQNNSVIQAKKSNIPPLPGNVVSHQLIGNSTTRKMNLLVAKYNAIDPKDNDYKKHHKLLRDITQLIASWNIAYAGGQKQKVNKMDAISALSRAVDGEMGRVEQQAGPNQLVSGAFYEKATPTLKGSAKKDTLTEVGDAASLVHGTAAIAGGVGKAAMTLGGEGVGEALTILGTTVASIAGIVGIGMSVFGIAENAVRYRDAQIRLAAFTVAYKKFESSPLAPYIQAAVQQQELEKSRRWKRVAVNAAILGLSIAALVLGATTPLGLVFAAIGAVLAIGKAVETIRNLYRKSRASDTLRESAVKVLDGLKGSREEANAVFTLLDSLGIKPITAEDVEEQNDRYREAVSMLAPHLGRAKVAAGDAAKKESDQVMEQASAEAEAYIERNPAQEAQSEAESSDDDLDSIPVGAPQQGSPIAAAMEQEPVF